MHANLAYDRDLGFWGLVGIAELLVGDGVAGDLGGGADVLAHVRDELVLELVVRHAYDA